MDAPMHVARVAESSELTLTVKWGSFRDVFKLSMAALSFYIYCLYGGLLFIVMLDIFLHLITINAYEDSNYFNEFGWKSFSEIVYPVVVLFATWINFVPLYAGLKAAMYDCFNLLSGTSELAHRIKFVFALCRGDNVAAYSDHIDPSLVLWPISVLSLFLDLSKTDNNVTGGIEGIWFTHLHYAVWFPVLALMFVVGRRIGFCCTGRSYENAVLDTFHYKGITLWLLPMLFGLADIWYWEQIGEQDNRQQVNLFWRPFIDNGAYRWKLKGDLIRGWAYLCTHLCFNAPLVSVVTYMSLRWIQSILFTGWLFLVYLFLGGGGILYLSHCVLHESSGMTDFGLDLFAGTFPQTVVLLAVLKFAISSFELVRRGQNPNYRISLGAENPYIIRFFVVLGISVVILLLVQIYPRGYGIAEIEQPNSRPAELFSDRSVEISHFGMKLKYKIQPNRSTRAPLQPWEVPGYSICDLSWPSSKGSSNPPGLSALDLATLAQLTYFDWNITKHKSFLETTTSMLLDEAVIVKGHLLNEATLYEFEFPQRQLTVLGIRGTDPFKLNDALQDARLWLEPTASSLLSLVFPLVALWPEGTIARFSLASRIFRDVFRTKSKHQDYDKLLFEHIKSRIMNADPQMRFLLTGHSLGGGLAGILSSQLNQIFSNQSKSVSSVTFSAPGLRLGRKKFGTRQRDYASLHTNIIPTRDIVPTVDMQMGLIQHTICNVSHVVQPIACHVIGLAVCDLMARCGDASGRYSGCSFHPGAFQHQGTNQDDAGKVMLSIYSFLQRDFRPMWAVMLAIVIIGITIGITWHRG